MDQRTRYAFWVHQGVEYALGFFLFLTAIRLVGPPMVHALGGGLLFVTLAAITKGPLAALRWLSRGAHRVADIALAALLAASPLVLRMDNVGMIMLAEAIALATCVLAWRTAYVDKPKAPRSRSSDQVIDTVTKAAAGGARVAGELLGRAGREGPRKLGRFVGKHKRRPS